jgi:hypothetical protein
MVGTSKLLALTFDKQGIGLNPFWLDVYFENISGFSCSIVESWSIP